MCYAKYIWEGLVRRGARDNLIGTLKYGYSANNEYVRMGNMNSEVFETIDVKQRKST